jgi:hypothetical protein
MPSPVCQGAIVTVRDVARVRRDQEAGCRKGARSGPEGAIASLETVRGVDELKGRALLGHPGCLVRRRAGRASDTVLCGPSRRANSRYSGRATNRHRVRKPFATEAPAPSATERSGLHARAVLRPGHCRKSIREHVQRRRGLSRAVLALGGNTQGPEALSGSSSTRCARRIGRRAFSSREGGESARMQLPGAPGRYSPRRTAAVSVSDVRAPPTRGHYSYDSTSSELRVWLSMVHIFVERCSRHDAPLHLASLPSPHVLAARRDTSILARDNIRCSARTCGSIREM